MLCGSIKQKSGGTSGRYLRRKWLLQTVRFRKGEGYVIRRSGSRTSAVKLLLMDGEGKIRKIVSREYPLYFPHPGWSEQKPEDWYAMTIDGLKELLADSDKSELAGISFGGQMHGLVILDDQDQVIRPAILWNDGRTTKETAYLNEVIGKETLSKYTANIAFTGFTAPKILWVKENERRILHRSRRLCCRRTIWHISVRLYYRCYRNISAPVCSYQRCKIADVESRRILDICGVEKRYDGEDLPESAGAMRYLLPGSNCETSVVDVSGLCWREPEDNAAALFALPSE